MSSKEVITQIGSRSDFMSLLERNPGFIVIKLGANWCAPCKRIAKHVEVFFSECPDNVICCDIDVDTSSDMYSFLKTKKMVNGIPGVLVYGQDNTSYIPDESHTGGNVEFFKAFASAMLAKFSPHRPPYLFDHDE